jgi:hypothetical protein
MPFWWSNAAYKEVVVDNERLVEPNTYRRDDCKVGCSHNWHGTTCKYCPCPGPFPDPESSLV